MPRNLREFPIINELHGISWDLCRDPLHKIIVDRIIDHPITSLMLAFAAEAVGGPGDDKSMCGIAEANGAL